MASITETISKLLSHFSERKRQLVMLYGEKFFRKLEKDIAYFSLIGDASFFEDRQFVWVAELEKNWSIVRQELDFILKHTYDLPNFQDLSQDQYSITQDNRWKTYGFYCYGIKAEKNCARCPETTRLIENIPGMKTAFFSILLPHKQIPEHRGPYKGVLRYHLGLKIPSTKAEDCGIRVGSEIRHWQEGKSLIFDDTFPHAAWNNTDDIRAVLFIDFIRPLRFPLSIINHFFIKLIAISPYIQDVKINQEKWDRRLDEAFGESNE
jgi:beta-hydroxylase